MFQTQEDKKGIGECLVGLGGVAAAIGNLERAARLFGAAEALREALGATLWPANRIAYERDASALRAQLNADKLAATWTEGRALTLEQAIELALSE